jgi:hypothetical protein
MTPEEYEHLVAEVLRCKCWDAHVTPYVRDYGLDMIAQFSGPRRRDATITAQTPL